MERRTIDWEVRRYKIAAAILPYCAETTRNILVAGHGIGGEFAGMTLQQAVARQAVYYADALIEELKREQDGSEIRRNA